MQNPTDKKNLLLILKEIEFILNYNSSKDNSESNYLMNNLYSKNNENNIYVSDYSYFLASLKQFKAVLSQNSLKEFRCIILCDNKKTYTIFSKLLTLLIRRNITEYSEQKKVFHSFKLYYKLDELIRYLSTNIQIRKNDDVPTFVFILNNNPKFTHYAFSSIAKIFSIFQKAFVPFIITSIDDMYLKYPASTFIIPYNNDKVMKINFLFQYLIKNFISMNKKIS